MPHYLTGKITNVAITSAAAPNETKCQNSVQMMDLTSGDEVTYSLSVEPTFLRVGDIFTLKLNSRKQPYFWRNHTAKRYYQSGEESEFLFKVIAGVLLFAGLMAIPMLIFGVFGVLTGDGYGISGLMVLTALLPVGLFYLNFRWHINSLDSKKKRHLKDADNFGIKHQDAVDKSIERRRAANDAI